MGRFGGGRNDSDESKRGGGTREEMRYKRWRIRRVSVISAHDYDLEEIVSSPPLHAFPPPNYPCNLDRSIRFVIIPHSFSFPLLLLLPVPPAKPIIYDAKRRDMSKLLEAYPEGADLFLVCEVHGGKRFHESSL